MLAAMWTLLLAGCLIDEDLYRERLGDLTAPVGDSGGPDADTADSASTDTGPVDADHDGVAADADCDDQDAGRFPGNPETCDDVDQDCDELVDEDVVESTVGAAELFPDGDGDGFGWTEDATWACPPVDGWTATSGDCDDQDPDVHPEAGEALDGVDGDCNDVVDDLDASRDLEAWVGTEAYGRAGEALLLHDLDGDGAPELYVGAPGREGATDPAGVWRVTDPAAGGTLADLAWSGAAGSRFGAALAGWEGGIAIGAPEEEGGGVYLGGVRWGLSYGVAEAGSALSVGDTDGDGIRELLIGAPGWTRTTQGGGAVFLVDVTEPDLDLDVDAKWQCFGAQERERVGGAVVLWDVDDDGYDDVIAGAAEHDDTGADNGMVYVLPTWVSDCDTSDAWVAISGASAGDTLGRSLAAGADADGDGLQELAIGAPGADGVAQDGGAVYVFESLRAGTMSAGTRDLQLDASATSQLVGLDLFAVPSGALLVGSSRGGAAWILDDASGLVLASVGDLGSVSDDFDAELGAALSGDVATAWIAAPGTSSEAGAVYVLPRR